MTIDILMPALSDTMTEGKIVRWLKAEGDEVNSGEVIAEIEVDKATMEIATLEQGRIGRILISEDSNAVAVNTVIAILLEEDEDIGSIGARKRSAMSNPISNIDSYSQSMREALRDAIAEEMRRDSDVFLIGEDVGENHGAYGVSNGLLEEFGPKRVIDTPTKEYSFVGLAAGAAMAGLRPIVEFMNWNIGMQAIDHIVNSAAKIRYMSGGVMSVPIVFRGPNGIVTRSAAQFSQDFSSWYAHCPGIKVVAPANAADAKGLLKAAIRDPNPVVFLENESLYDEKSEVLRDSENLIPIGKAKICREGSDVTITAFSRTIAKVLHAAEILKSEGISVEVIDLRTLRPLDRETLTKSVQKTHRLISAEEGWPQCGIGAEIAAIAMEDAFDSLDAPVIRVTGKDTPMPYAENLENMAVPSVADIVAAAKSVCCRI